MGLKWEQPWRPEDSQFPLKSDQNGIEIHLTQVYLFPNHRLKSDQNGIEILCQWSSWGTLHWLKSDQNGIEMLLFLFITLNVNKLKSDQNGIEILFIVNFQKKTSFELKMCINSFKKI